jgi:hypothetical protein
LLFKLFNIESVEVHPIKMKIDYKPKHIDYTNLKEGNLVELMNFFHFDAAEMTLSNVKLTGVSCFFFLVFFFQ